MPRVRPLPQRVSFRSFRQQPVVIEDRLQQHLSACGALLLRGELCLIVTDAVTAGHEDHGARRYPRHIAGVVTGARNDVACRIAVDLCALAHAAHAFGIKVHRRLIEDSVDLGFEAKGVARLGRCGAPFLLHGIEDIGPRMPQVDGEEDFPRHDIG